MYEKILVPIDGSETGERALEQAASLATLCHARVRLLHVLDTLWYANGFERPEIYEHQLRPSMVRAGHRILTAARHIYASAGYRKVAEEPHNSFGFDLVAETWELTL